MENKRMEMSKAQLHKMRSEIAQDRKLKLMKQGIVSESKRRKFRKIITQKIMEEGATLQKAEEKFDAMKKESEQIKQNSNL